MLSVAQFSQALPDITQKLVSFADLSLISFAKHRFQQGFGSAIIAHFDVRPSEIKLGTCIFLKVQLIVIISKAQVELTIVIEI